MEAVVPTSVAQMEQPPPSLSHSWWPELQLQSRSTRPESCHRTPDWVRLQPAEYCLAVWLPVCSTVSDKWPHWPSHPAATQQPVYSVRQQQSSAPVGASTCWHCRKRDCRQTGKGNSKIPSTSPLHLIQRSQNPSETEAEISLETKKTMDMTHRKTKLTPLTGGPKPPFPTAYWSLLAKKTSEVTRSCWFSPLWMWLRGANSWAHFSGLPTPGDSTPTALARRHWSGHQALGASCRTTADGRLSSSHRPEDLARSSHRTQKKKCL